MAVYKKCDICGENKEAFTDNTTKTVTVNNKTVRFFIKTSFSPPVPDVCTDCFKKGLVKLRRLLESEEV